MKSTLVTVPLIASLATNADLWRRVDRPAQTVNAPADHPLGENQKFAP